jgi:hypothetical protein
MAVMDHASTAAMRERNRELLAQRLRWPEGALEAVRRLEAQHPRYSVHWSSGGHEGPPGFYGRLTDAMWDQRQKLYGATPDELAARLTEHEAANPPFTFRPLVRPDDPDKS